MKTTSIESILVAIASISVVIATIIFEKQVEQTPSPSNHFVARVIFSEAAHQCSNHERKLIASVIKNRINHEGFGKLQSLERVARQKNAFSCINDPNNSNWKLTKNHQDIDSRHIWQQCLKLSSGDFNPIIGRSGRPIVYFHDKSISKPASWNNKWWTAHKELETEHFIFYSVTKTHQNSPKTQGA